MTTTQLDVVDHDESARRFVLRRGGVELGHVAYRRDDDGAFVLHHTEVDPDRDGEGLGGRLAAGTFAELRRLGADVVVTCPFLRRWHQRHPDA